MPALPERRRRSPASDRRWQQSPPVRRPAAATVRAPIRGPVEPAPGRVARSEPPNHPAVGRRRGCGGGNNLRYPRDLQQPRDSHAAAVLRRGSRTSSPRVASADRAGAQRGEVWLGASLRGRRGPAQLRARPQLPPASERGLWAPWETPGGPRRRNPYLPFASLSRGHAPKQRMACQIASCVDEVV